MAVIETDVLELDRTEDRLGLVTTFPGTGGVGNLGPGLGFLVGQGDILGELVETVEFALDLACQTRFEVAVGAGDVCMGRHLPGFIEGFHVVAGVAEFGAGGKLHRAPEDQWQEQYGCQYNYKASADFRTHVRI
jgi:hypothetical protein